MNSVSERTGRQPGQRGQRDDREHGLVVDAAARRLAEDAHQADREHDREQDGEDATGGVGELRDDGALEDHADAL